MVVPLGNRPQTSEPSPSYNGGSGDVVFGEGQSAHPSLSFSDFLRDTGAVDGLVDLMTQEELFNYRLRRVNTEHAVIDPAPPMDAVEEAAVLSEILGRIRTSLTSDSVQPATEPLYADRIALGSIEANTQPVKVPLEEETEHAPIITGYSLKTEDSPHLVEVFVRSSEASAAKSKPKAQEPEVLIATEVLTDPKESYAPAGKQTKERVQAISFSAQKVLKTAIGKFSKKVKSLGLSAEGINIGQGNNLSRRKLIALGLTGVLGLLTASGLATNRGDGERSLFGGSSESAIDIHVKSGSWAEQIPTVMRWEQDVVRLIKEYDAKAIETNNTNKREKRPGVIPYGAVDSGLVLSMMAVLSGGNQFATDKYADPSNPDKISGGLLMISREAGRKVVIDFEPTNSEHSIKAGIAYAQVLLSMVPENEAKDRPTLITSALQGKQANQPNTPYPVSSKLLDEMLAWVPALDSEWHLPKNQHAENWLKDPVAKERLQLAVNEAKDSPLASITTATQPAKRK